MKTYQEFCKRYELDIDDEQSKKDYQEYQDKLRLIEKAVKAQQKDSPKPNHLKIVK